MVPLDIRYAKKRPRWKDIGIDVQRGDRARVMKDCFRNTREIVELGFNVLVGTQADSNSCCVCPLQNRPGTCVARRQELLPTRYVHVVFTLPRHLAPLVLQNKKVLYSRPTYMFIVWCQPVDCLPITRVGSNHVTISFFPSRCSAASFAESWFCQLDLASFDLFFWPHLPDESAPVSRSERSPAAPVGRRV